MYAHDKAHIFICTDVDNIWMGMEIGFKFQGFHEPLFLTHAQVHIIQFLMIAPSASGKNIMSWLRKFFEAIHPA